jgi:cellulose synthase/poly-beta-1,6-N-acetylglucosamine synthase-like glycosyltransferase
MSASDQKSSEVPFVSVIVPVYNDAVRLQTCLKALENQRYPVDSYEVIVVDNNSDESIDKVIDAFPHAVSVFEGKQSSYAARNRGVDAARGNILAFTDADCIPKERWLQTGVQRLLFEGKSAGIVGGEIEVTFEDPEAPQPAEILDAMTGFAQEAVCTKRDFSATANLFTSRRIIENIGNFNDNLKSAGDKEFGRRVANHGYQVVYEPAAIVCHPARQTPKALFRKRHRLAKGQYDLRVQQGKYPLPELLRDAVDHLRPMKGMIPRILSDSRFTSPMDRARGLLIYLVMELIFPFEKIRLWVQE